MSREKKMDRKFLKIEWSDKNKHEFENIKPYSDKKYYWKCSKCQHEWEASMTNRTSGKNCPACANRVATERNCLARLEVSKELHSNIDPKMIVEGSNKVVEWKCSKCGHIWKARVVDRVNGRGCRSCAGQMATENNNMTLNSPWYLIEWNYNKNGDPKKYTIKSNKNVYWVCKECSFEWRASINSRAIGNGNCPKCSGLICDEKNSVYSDKFLIEYWNDENDPKLIFRRSGIDFNWKCKICSFTWIMSPHKFSCYRGCPNCSTGSRVSKQSRKWLKKNAPDNIIIEFPIRMKNGRLIKVDAYDENTNTVYEFFGDYWHGNPKIFPNGKNSTNGISFKKLYEDTLERINFIKELGFNMIYIWETDWKSGKMASD